MFFIHLIKAVIVAIFYCIYLGCLASAAKKVGSDSLHQAGFVIGIFLKHIICGATLTVLLNLVGLFDFNFINIFICMTALMVLEVEGE